MADRSIRSVEPADLPRLQDIRRRAFAPVFQSFREIVGPEIAAVAFAGADAEQAGMLEEVCAPESSHTVLVVCVGTEIAGFVAFTVDADRHIGEIGLNAVDPRFAGRGLGTWMYGQTLDLMRRRGATVATVGTGGDPSHAAARRAYKKCGFGPAIPSLYLYRKL